MWTRFNLVLQFNCILKTIFIQYIYEKRKELKYVTEIKFKVSEGKFKKFSTNMKSFYFDIKEIQAFREEMREYRQTMSSLMHTDIKQERNVENLRIRVETLETKIK